jgi:hypothetical protein
VVEQATLRKTLRFAVYNSLDNPVYTGQSGAPSGQYSAPPPTIGHAIGADHVNIANGWLDPQESTVCSAANFSQAPNGWFNGQKR